MQRKLCKNGKHVDNSDFVSPHGDCSQSPQHLPKPTISPGFVVPSSASLPESNGELKQVCSGHPNCFSPPASDALHHLRRLNDPERSIKVTRKLAWLSYLLNPLTDPFLLVSVWCERSGQAGITQLSRSICGPHGRWRANEYNGYLQTVLGPHLERVL